MMIRRHRQPAEIPDPAEDMPNDDDLNDLTVSELRTLLEGRGLSSSGKKQELIERLSKAE